jgi:hypothetical protein
MPTPSLILVPARFKTGKLYTPVATTSGGVVLGASGDFNVTRATIATRVNASGLIESVASGVPRLDYYTSGGTAGCPALLVEPQAQNLVPNGVGFTSSTGVQTSGITDSPAVAISGTVVTKNEASGTIRYLGQNFSASALASGTTYTVSRFFKYNGVAFNTSIEHNNAAQWGGVGWVQAVVLSAASGVTLGASTLCTGSIENFGNGWHRVNVRVTTGAAISGAATVAVLSILPAALSTGQGFLTACPQLETGSVATSYIPTTTAAVTRNADVITLSGAVSGCIGQTEGTIYAEVDYRNFANITMLSVQTASIASGAIRIENSNNGTELRCHIRGASGAIVMDQSITSPNLLSGINKIAVGYSSAASGLCIALNGTVVFTGTAAAAFTVNPDRILLGSREVSAASQLFFNNRIRAAALYTTRLTNAQLAALTTL